MAPARQNPVSQGDHFLSTERKANPLEKTVTTWAKYHNLLSMERNQYIVPNEKRAVSQIAPEFDSLVQPEWIRLCKIRYTITVLVAAISRENVVVLKPWMPKVPIKGSMRMAGKGGTGTNQCPLKNVNPPVSGGLMRYNFPCRIAYARRLN